MISSDALFRMGSTHTICQDYALAGTRDGIPFAILSDGCSGSPTGEPGSPFTDWGARFLVRAATGSYELSNLANGHFPESVMSQACGMLRAAGLGRTALDATLLAAVADSDEWVRTYQAGDGVIAVGEPGGCIRYTSLHFGANMPLYLSYRFASADEYTQYLQEAKTLEVTRNVFKHGDGWAGRCVESFDLANIEDVRIRVFAGHTTVLLMSDGVESFIDRNGQPVPLESVLEQIFAFKQLGGPFLQRRCQMFLKRFCAEHGWTHTDDFSIAGLAMADP